MKLHIRESILQEDCDLEIFTTLLEMITKTDTLHDATDEFIKYKYSDAKQWVFNKIKNDRSVITSYPIDDIKQDIKSFVTDTAAELEKLDKIDSATVIKSDDLGFSTYLHIDFAPPTDSRLNQYYSKNQKRYKDIVFRISDHDMTKSAIKKYGKPKDEVRIEGKTYIDVEKELITKVKLAITSIINIEKSQLGRIKKEEEKKQKQDSDKKESLKLRIRE